MKLGLTLPNLTPAGTRQNVLTLAREAERLGYDSLWVTDRLLYPIQPRQLMRGYPWPEVYRYALDPLDTLIFAAGVTDTVEVVQAQEALASADENYISSLYRYNVSKASLARAMGLAEVAFKQMTGGSK